MAQPKPPASSQESKANANEELRQFHKTAADISKDIAATSAMLSELAQIVKQKSLFADDTQHINSLVMRIKGNVESLNGRLDDAAAVIARQKRRLGKNSQAGQEASNLVGQLKEEFGEAAAGFKKVLQQRTDTMKETTDLKRQVYGGDDDDDPGDVPVLNLENKPPVYHTVTPTAGMNHAPASFGGAFPTLDLTSGMSAGESSSSASQLPRPRKYRYIVSLFVLSSFNLFYIFSKKLLNQKTIVQTELLRMEVPTVLAIRLECGFAMPPVNPCHRIQEPIPLSITPTAHRLHPWIYNGWNRKMDNSNRCN